MNKLFLRFLSLILIILITLMSLSVIVNGMKPTAGSGGSTPTEVNSFAGKILGVGQVICYAAAFVLIMWMGVKWLTSAPEGKAELKKGLIIASVGALLLFGAGTIMMWVGNTIEGNLTAS